MKKSPHPQPFLATDNSDAVESKVNRVTMRFDMIREIGGQESQVFPPANYNYAVVPIAHRESAFIKPTHEVGAEAAELETGWIKEPRLVALLNRTRWSATVKPSQEQLEEINKHVILAGFSPDALHIRIPPGVMQPLHIKAGARVFIKAEYGSPILSYAVV